ncbi:MAG: branched-chain amino acid ABC transporter ATP-binding protein/permease [Pseudomonadota bacterium]
MDKKVIGILIAGALLAVIPWLGLPTFYESFIYLVLHWIILATSWNILSGYTGYFSFGHGAFFGAGMYTTAVLTVNFNMPFLWSLPFAGLVAALIGLAVGFVVFRTRKVRGELFALLTLAVTFVLATIVLNTPIDGGPGVYMTSVAVPKFGPSASSSIYLIALAVAVATVLIAYLIHGSRLGTGLFAIHDDEDVAEVMGVPTFRYKMVALCMSCGLAGLAGGIHALFVSYVTAGETFNITVPLTVVLMSVLGGTRHWAGPALGAVVITALQYAFTAGDSAVVGKAVTGAVLISAILFMPNGILYYFLKRRKKAGLQAPVEKNEAAAVPLSDGEVITRAPHVLSNEILLDVREVSKAFSGVQALNKVSFNVRKGEILGLLGPNGSGKSTFINVASGHFASDGGEILLGGIDLARLPAHAVSHCGVARTYQIPRPFAHMSVLDNVSMAAMFGSNSLDRKASIREAWECLEFTGLAAKALSLPEDLNLHQRKFLELARALASRPQLVLLDEVLSGLTPGEINEAVRMIQKIRAQGATIIFVEHVMRAVMALTDRVVVLHHGQMIASGLATDVMQQPEVITAYLGKQHA